MQNELFCQLQLTKEGYNARNSQHFTELVGSSQYPQQLATGPYPEPRISSHTLASYVYNSVLASFP
jgi:hypothetical protein